MIGYTITGYDVSRIKCTPDDVENLPTDVKEGSIAISVDGSQNPPTETPYVFWKGEWVEISLE